MLLVVNDGKNIYQTNITEEIAHAIKQNPKHYHLGAVATVDNLNPVIGLSKKVLHPYSWFRGTALIVDNTDLIREWVGTIPELTDPLTMIR